MARVPKPHFTVGTCRCLSFLPRRHSLPQMFTCSCQVHTSHAPHCLARPESTRVLLVPPSASHDIKGMSHQQGVPGSLLQDPNLPIPSISLEVTGGVSLTTANCVAFLGLWLLTVCWGEGAGGEGECSLPQGGNSTGPESRLAQHWGC